MYDHIQNRTAPINFSTPNSLILKNTPPSHFIAQITHKQQNIELVFIVIEKKAQIKTKKDTIVQCLVADSTGCMFMNFYNQVGNVIKEGDILYASGIYATHFKDLLLLYQGNMSIIRRINQYYMTFNTHKNMSKNLSSQQLHTK